MVIAQEQCGTVLLQEHRHNHAPGSQKEAQFEQWLKNKKLQRQAATNMRMFQEAPVYRIPVVVHVVHNGEPVGEGSNIPDAQIISQIEVLNEDFRRRNSDTVNTPGIFLPVAADPQIEFVLAKTDPEGLSTNGIVRTQGSQRQWSIFDEQELTAQSYWPAEEYLNIWVTTLAGGLLGYAQYPVTDLLEGLEGVPDSRLTDGVTVGYQFFGSAEKGDFEALEAPFNRGRTTTHEVGHFLGLRHIWGDGGCDVDDFCDDTPQAQSSYTGCPRSGNSCGSRDMFQNYMDYTDDACMNIFTVCQTERMQIVLENAPRRQSLLNAQGLNEPIFVDNDAGIRQIISPQEGLCSEELTPTIQVRNYGSNSINSVTISLNLNGIVIANTTFAVDLDLADTTTLSFESIMIDDFEPQELTFDITGVNSVQDGNPLNDSRSVTFNVIPQAELPIATDFSAIPENWTVRNPDGISGWQIAPAAGNGTVNNTAAFVNFYEDSLSLGSQTTMLTPGFDLTNYREAYISFRYAHAIFPGMEMDRLIVALSADCGNTFTAENTLFDRRGSELSTVADERQQPFTPANRTEWKRMFFDLTDYLDQGELILAFIAQNGYGNNLYLDDVRVYGKQQYENDITVLEIISPVAAGCEEPIAAKFIVQNQGTNTISDFTAGYNYSSLTYEEIGFEVNLLPEAVDTFQLPAQTLPAGVQQLSVSLTNINNAADDFAQDNNLFRQFTVDNTREIIPYRALFTAASLEQEAWSSFVRNRDANNSWSVTGVAGTESGTAASLPYYTIDDFGREDWLISPVMDFSTALEASVFFNLAYAETPNYSDTLMILASLDCGLTFTDTLVNRNGPRIAGALSRESFVPSSDDDWQLEFIDLSDYAGLNNLRFAFVARNGFGNNLYIENAEFFVTNDPTPVRTADDFVLYPNPADAIFYFTFNLETRLDTHLYLYDVQGKLLQEQFLPNTLNQTYPVPVHGLKDGIYFVRIINEQFSQTRKVLVRR